MPFDHLARLSTSSASRAARALLVRRADLAQARGDAERLVGSRENGLSAAQSRACRAVLRSGAAPAEHATAGSPAEINRFLAVAATVPELERELGVVLLREVSAARQALLESSCSVLPSYLVFGAGEFRDRLHDLLADHAVDGHELPPRNARARERERHLLLYLQRVCAKNDTFSEFGPSGWGTVVEGTDGVALDPQRGIARRHAFLERWTAHTLVAALNEDAAVRPELAPGLHPSARIEDHSVVLTESGETVALTDQELQLVLRCDGQTPAHSLGAAAGALEDLAARGVLRWHAEVPALDPAAFHATAVTIRMWRDTPVRARWSDRVGRIDALPQKFAAADDLQTREKLMQQARAGLNELGARQATQRSLYAAANPIAEECFRDCRFTIGEAMVDDLAREIEPWIDLWRDTYAYVASRVAAGLRGMLQTTPSRAGAVPLPAFLAHCAANRLPLTGHGIVALAVLAFQEVKAAFREMVSAWPDAAEWELTAEHCAFVRRNFEFPRFDEYTYPSADLQISATSTGAVERGEYQWIVSELHPPVAMLHHALYWSCPDPATLSRALASTTCGRPGVHYGFFAADFTAHTVVRHMDALPELMTFVAPQPANRRWRAVPPAEVEVYVEEATGDVCLRKRGSQEYLGSFARAWVIPLGFHPFFFGQAPHMPRLRCGKAIVQRRSWTVRQDEIGPGDYTGISRDLVLAIERLRSEKDWPRYVYIRPTEQALRRSGAEGRDKDTKPVFVDFESYLSLEIFHRWLTKAGEVEVTEMLPDPDHLLWHEPDGRRTFELRTLIVPQS